MGMRVGNPRSQWCELTFEVCPFCWFMGMRVTNSRSQPYMAQRGAGRVTGGCAFPSPYLRRADEVHKPRTLGGDHVGFAGELEEPGGIGGAEDGGADGGVAVAGE